MLKQWLANWRENKSRKRYNNGYGWCAAMVLCGTAVDDIEALINAGNYLGSSAFRQGARACLYDLSSGGSHD